MVSLLVLLCALGVALPKPRNAPRPMMGKAKPRRAPPPRPRAPAPQTRHEASEALHSALSCEQVELLCSAANRTEAPDDAHAADADVSVLCASLQRECAAAAAAAAEAAARAANETAAAKRAAEAVDAKLASEALSLADAASNVRGTYMTRGEPKGEGWCCVRYVHIGKAAGSSFDLWRRYSKSIDPIMRRKGHEEVRALRRDAQPHTPHIHRQRRRRRHGRDRSDLGPRIPRALPGVPRLRPPHGPRDGRSQPDAPRLALPVHGPRRVAPLASVRGRDHRRRARALARPNSRLRVRMLNINLKDQALLLSSQLRWEMPSGREARQS